MDVVYFSVNNWFSGENYPPTKNFKKWLSDDFNQSFRNDEWCKENKLCVYYGCVDMSTNYTISAPREWVEKNCPELLTEYTQFVFAPEEGKTIPDHDDWYQLFLEYCEENFGITY